LMFAPPPPQRAARKTDPEGLKIRLKQNQVRWT
jgi:hypothetical protein